MAAARGRFPDPRSRTVAVLLTALVAFGPVSTDLYLPSLPAMVDAFGTSVSRAQLTLSMFMAGFAVGMLIYGPLADRFGRRPVLLGGILVYVAASIACLVADGIDALIAARFFQAVGACCGPVIGRAVVRDVHDRAQAARMLSTMASAMALAPAIAPIVGGWMFTLFGWRANFVLLTLFGVAVLVATWRLLGETNRHKDPGALRPARVIGTFGLLLRNRTFLGYTLVVSFGFAGLFSFISGSSFVIIDVLGLPPQYFGFAFMAVVVGYIIGAFSGGRLSGRVGIDRLLALGTALAVVAGGAAAVLSWLGLQSLATLIPFISVYFFATAWIIPLGTAGAMGPFPRIAGAVSSLLGFIQMTIGATAGYLVGALHDGTTHSLTTIMAVMGVASALAYWGLVRPAAAASADGSADASATGSGPTEPSGPR
ncbi:Bcr/CflA family efflux MFS transporter [Roseospira navarrensis]|uniref:Bcr/CflA family efflux transporter n=2 Tax=Roseospira navarrensis TaxID=140058 RepID=A0A7X2D442_9PROT|nr:Bcr/CflA family efflux MFS transporter [Roseospira navarrensis]